MSYMRLFPLQHQWLIMLQGTCYITLHELHEAYNTCWERYDWRSHDCAAPRRAAPPGYKRCNSHARKHVGTASYLVPCLRARSRKSQRAYRKNPRRRSAEGKETERGEVTPS